MGPTPRQVRRGLDDTTWTLYVECMQQGRAFEGEAERCRLEAQQAFEDVAAMKQAGRDRQAGEAERMLPQHERATDVRTNTMKAMADAKADHVYYATQAATYAQLATMKYAKASAVLSKLAALGVVGKQS